MNLRQNLKKGAAIAATGLLFAGPAKAQSYSIDCAILICLSGGWAHPSAECTAARAEFIRRVTPWPIEPPLQIWNCPMGVNDRKDTDAPDATQTYKVLFGDSSPLQSLPLPSLTEEITQEHAVLRSSGNTAPRAQNEPMLQPVQDYSNENGTADVDISNPVFDFVRSIRVYNIRIDDDRDSQADGGDCSRYASVRRGTYGQQGNFQWRSANRGDIPAAFGLTRSGCSLQARAVFIDWRDLDGNYGYERVNY